MFQSLLSSTRRRNHRRQPAQRPSAYHRRLACEPLEDRSMLSILGPAPELPGMVLVDPNLENLQGQVVYLNFEGAENVMYHGPVEIGPFDVPRFSVASAGFEAAEEAVILGTLGRLESMFGDIEVDFTTTEPANEVRYSTIFVGGDGASFAEYGSFVGLAEQVDIGNAYANDNAFVFSEVFVPGYSDVESLTAALARHIAHEAGHLLGYAHEPLSAHAGVLDAVANGTVTVEIVSAPSVVRRGELSDVEVRIKFEGNTKEGPWQVEKLGLYDEDPFFDDTIVELANPFEIASLGTWHTHTFVGVDLAQFDDDADGIELYAWGKVDDNTFNFFSPSAKSAIHQVQVVRDWTVMAYLCGDNDLERNEMIKFERMAEVGSSDEVSIVALYDRHPGYSPLYGDWTDGRRGLIRKGDKPRSSWGEQIPEPAMDDPATLASFVNWAVANHPADRYALVISNHGSGVLGGVCYDYTSGRDSSILTSELSQAFSGMGAHLDVVFFDACLQGMVEVAYEIVDYANVMVASQELSYRNDYKPVLTGLVDNPHWDAEQFGTHIVDSYAATYPSGSILGIDLTISAVDLSRMDALKDRLNEFATLMLDSASSDDWRGVLKAHGGVRRLFGEEGKEDYQYYDVREWMTRIESQDVSGAVKAAATAINDALSAAVISLWPVTHAPGMDAHGLSIYAPFAELHARYDPKLLKFVADTRWAEFVGPVGSSVVLIIDRSGSMGAELMNAAKSAASQFIDLMNPPEKIGVVSYSSSASVNYPLTEITDDSATKSAAKAAVNAITASGMTSIGAGIQVADNELDRFLNDRVRAMTVMTDGLHNTAPHPIDVIDAQVDDDITIYTIGFGPDADAALLTEIAALRNGKYYFAPGSSELSQIYRAVSGQMTGLQQLPGTTQSIQQGEQVTHEVLVDAGASKAIFAVDWGGSDVDLWLISPDGQVIDPAAALGDPLISFVSGDTYEFYTIHLPMAGVWEMVAVGVDIPSAGETIGLYAAVKSSITMSIATDKVTYQAGEQVHIEATLHDRFPILDATVVATIIGPADATFDTIEITLHDDGLHGDGEAGDGVYGGRFDQLLWPGNYTIQVRAEGTTFIDDPLIPTFDREFTRYDFLSVFTTPALFHDVVVDLQHYPVGQDSIVDDLRIDVRQEGDLVEVMVTNLTSPGVGDGVYYSGPAAFVRSLTILGSEDNERFVVEPNESIPIYIDGRGPTFAQLPPDSNPGGDHLEIDFAGTTGRHLTYHGRPDGDGVWEFGNRQPIEFTGIEKLNYFPVLAVSQDAGLRGRSEAWVRVYDAELGDLVAEMQAYLPDHRTGVTVTVADINGNGVPEVITAPGVNHAPEVKVFQLHAGGAGAGSLVDVPFLAYADHFRKGLQVAAGDVTGDGRADIVTVPRRGVAEVRVFENQGPAASQWIHADPWRQFAAFDTTFIGGATVAVGDLMGTGGAGQIVVGSGSGMRATVNVFDDLAGFGPNDYLPNPTRQFFPFGDDVRGGVDVALGRVRTPDAVGLDATLDLIVGAGRRGRSQVEVLDGRDGALLSAFQAYDDRSFNAPVRVAAKDINGDGIVEVFTAQGTDGRTGRVKRWDLSDPLNASAVDFLLLDQSAGRPGFFLG